MDKIWPIPIIFILVFPSMTAIWTEKDNESFFILKLMTKKSIQIFSGEFFIITRTDSPPLETHIRYFIQCILYSHMSCERFQI
jgi:hypothetical protein